MEMIMGICTYCGSTIQTQDDHVIARTKGGVSTVLACRACNQSKSAKPLMDWFRWLKYCDSYRWERVVQHNFGKRTEIADKVRRVRDS